MVLFVELQTHDFLEAVYFCEQQILDMRELNLQAGK